MAETTEPTLEKPAVKPQRITILTRTFSAAAMEFHRAKMAERGYRMTSRIEPAVFQMIEGEAPPENLFGGEPMFAVTFERVAEG